MTLYSVIARFKPGVDAEFGAGIINLPRTLAAAQKLLAGAQR